MRVLFYHTESGWTGTARAVLAIARGLAQRGHVVTIACRAETRLDESARAAGIETAPIDPTASGAGAAWDLRRVMKDRFVEVVVVSNDHEQVVANSARLLAARGAVVRRIPSFESLDGPPGAGLARRMAAAGAVVTTSRELEPIQRGPWAIPPIVAPLGLDPSSADGVDAAPRRALGAPADGLIIACNYDPSGRYRIATIFRTLSLLAPRHHSRLHVVVFGPGSLDEGLRMHASALGVGSLVSFLGENNEAAILRSAAVGWIVSGADTAAYGCLDCMAMRIPVIADRSPLAHHYIADGISGTLLSPGDPSYTASTVAADIADSERHAAKGTAGHTPLQRDFTETAMIDGFEHAINTAGDRTKWAAK
jgi:glycosyltransferase involved in cell wall biosynthesis